ncbi:phage tail protein [Novosphingobium sp.]|uniref:GTA baseplate fiber-binding domain-containing protein n=1 Tax=Novosphingobium sp. TaxID=1874826 RepID=UPI002613FC66|nr:phage tail protein [Novosphingobium sp.]
MATLILSAVGTAIGGPLGGALGALIGQQFDSAVIGKRRVEGARLKELSVQTSSYGSPIPMHFGTIRASGSVIWATELAEQQERSGGKGRPSVTTYSYTASFAVAVASRPIVGIGRIWADGNLLRGHAGDLKVGGTLRIHTGHGDQGPDPLLVQAEGEGLNPAYRNIAYVVFEDLALADYGNRLPSLTLEVIADDGAVSLADILHAAEHAVDTSNLDQVTLSGFTFDQGSTADIVPVLGEIAPIFCNVQNERLTLGLADSLGETEPLTLPPPCAGGDSAEDARQEGWARRRDALPPSQQCVVRYYDIARDYQPGLQRSLGRSEPGDVALIELPVAMNATEAATVADKAARRRTEARDTLRYRITEISAECSPGAIVRTPVAEGNWRIEQWEWQADGVMLDLVPVAAVAPLSVTADPGRANPSIDLVAVPTRIVAFELPWDGTGNGDVADVKIAASAQTAGWTGAALYVQSDDGTLTPVGSTGRRRAVVGQALSALAGTSPLVFDAQSRVELELAAEDLTLGNATWAQLMQGANRALLGSEIIQFSRAERIAGRQWQLSGLLRGRGGTENAVSDHTVGEPFALIDDRLVSPTGSQADLASGSTIVGIGLGDSAPASSAIINIGLTTRPLAPVHGSVLWQADGSALLRWIRRARGSWGWLDGVEVPLGEPSELWEVAFGPASNPTQVWQTTESQLLLPAALAQSLSALPGANFAVRQIGLRSKSDPLVIALTA